MYGGGGLHNKDMGVGPPDMVGTPTSSLAAAGIELIALEKVRKRSSDRGFFSQKSFLSFISWLLTISQIIDQKYSLKNLSISE